MFRTYCALAHHLHHEWSPCRFYQSFVYHLFAYHQCFCIHNIVSVLAFINFIGMILQEKTNSLFLLSSQSSPPYAQLSLALWLIPLFLPPSVLLATLFAVAPIPYKVSMTDSLIACIPWSFIDVLLDRLKIQEFNTLQQNIFLFQQNLYPPQHKHPPTFYDKSMPIFIEANIYN